MSKLPVIDLNRTSSQFNPYVERVQALLTAAGDNPASNIDGRNGPLTRKALTAHQKKHNSGNGRGGADLVVGAKTGESLLTGKRWPRA